MQTETLAYWSDTVELAFSKLSTNNVNSFWNSTYSLR